MKTNKPSHHLNAALIMQRLPFHRQLSSSQSLLIKCAPIWEKWAKNNLSNEALNKIQLSHFNQEELTLHCENAINATQIKQQQQTLLQFFHDEGIKEIKQISVRITNNHNHLRSFSTNNSEKSSVESANRATNELNENALNSIKSIQKEVGNEALSESLNRLLRTIEKNQ